MTSHPSLRDRLIRAFRMLPDPVEAADAVIAVVEAMGKKPRRKVKRKR